MTTHSLRSIVVTLLLCLAPALAARDPVTSPSPAPAPAARSAAPRMHGLAEGTRCSACHVTSSWKDVRFDHAQTGFLLRGAHEKAQCSGCHAADLSQPVPTTCAACHTDGHRGEFGARCSGCHTEASWKTTFTADAHRLTGFPLQGRHAFISCEECHPNQRDRGFSRAGAAQCLDCHAKDVPKAGSAVDHTAFGFGTSCRDCHTPMNFKNARFTAHAQCFQIASGPHAGIACLHCHSSLSVPAVPGSCATGTANCIQCHQCGTIAPRHASVPGYDCKNLKCYACHMFASGPSQPRMNLGFPGKKK